MTILAAVILVIVLSNYLLDAIASSLNMRAATPEVPTEFADIYDRSTYANSQVYLKRKTRLNLIEGSVDLIVLLFFWFLGGFQQLDDFARSFGLNEIYTGVIFFVLLSAGASLYKMPFSVYSTFVVEEEFGLNNTSWQTFVFDRVKSLVLSALLVLPILALVLFFFQEAGAFAWLWAWLVVSGITLLLQILAPTLIMPLFNKFTPLEDGALKRAILIYTKKVDFPVDNLLSMDGSKRSKKSNAFFTGFGSQKRIVLFDTLIENHTTNELLGIVAHEVGHYKKKHIYIGAAQAVLATGLMFALLGLLLPMQELYDAFYLMRPSIYAGLVFAGFLFSPLSLAISLVSNYLSRKHEFEADEFAVATTGMNTDLIAALKKLARSNLSNLTPHPFYVRLNYSHPPLLERIKRIRSL